MLEDFFDTKMKKFKNQYSRGSKKYSYQEGDTIGVGLDFEKQVLFFTKNGESPGQRKILCSLHF